MSLGCDGRQTLAGNPRTLDLGLTMVPEQQLPPTAGQRDQLRQTVVELVKERGKEHFQEADLTRSARHHLQLDSQLFLPSTGLRLTMGMSRGSGSTASSSLARTA